MTGTGTITLRGRNREDLVGGRVFVQLYTKQVPLGVERQSVTLR
jgi:hypothetical protein